MPADSRRSKSAEPYQNLHYETIDDFTPGIYSKGSSSGVVASAPKGAAQAGGTWGCYALKEGALVPLPKMVGTLSVPSPDTDANALLGRFMVNGMFAFGPVGPPATNPSGFPDQIFMGVEYLKVGAPGTREFRYYRLNVDSTTQAPDTLASISSAQAVTSDQYLGLSFATSRMNPTSPYLTPGNPVLVTSWSPPAFAADRHVYVFPNPNTPGTTGIADIATNRSGLVIGHQSRIVLLEDNTYPFGANSGDQIPNNEQISYNDPPNSFVTATPGNTIGTQRLVVTAEYPNGYGAFGSISAGELFLIKSQGGGAIVSGDLGSPTVTRLPGVVSTMGVGCRAASTPNGLFYYSRFNGLYNWRGSDTSSKVSDQLDPKFIVTSNLGKYLNVQVHVQEWADFVLMTNGYLHDIPTGAWWILDNPATYTPQWFTRGYFGETMYAIPASYSNAGGLAIIRRYDRTTPASVFNWTGHPLYVSRDRVIDVREIILIAQGSGTVAVTCTALDGTTQTETFTINNTSQPQRLRLATQCRGYNIVPTIVSTAQAAGAAPSVYSVEFGYREQVKATAA